MAQNSQPGLDSNWQDRRRGTRLNSQVRIAIEWDESAGKSHRVEGTTRVVNAAGCMALLPHELPLDLRVRVSNLNVSPSEFIRGTVVWKGRETPDGNEVGIEFAQSQLDFWGLQQ
jgi:hypothetical protein